MDEIFNKPEMFYRLVEKAMPFRGADDLATGRSRLMIMIDGVEHKLYMRSRIHSEMIEDTALSMKNRPPEMKKVYRMEFMFVIEDFFRMTGDYAISEKSTGRNIYILDDKWRHKVISTYGKTMEEMEHLLILLSLQ